MKTGLFKRVFAALLAISMITIPSLSFAANEETVLFNLDFSNVADGNYSTSEIKTLTGETRIAENGDAPNTYYVSSGVAKIKTALDYDGTVYMNGMFENAVTTGYLELESNMVFADLDPSGGLRQHLNVYSSTGKLMQLANSQRWCGTNLYAIDASNASIAFTNGTTAYNCGSTNLNLKANVYRSTELEDWKVKMYNAGTGELILTTTLDKDSFPSITGIGGGFWRSTGGDYGQCSFNISKLTAKLIDKDLNELFNLDFSGVANGKYNLAQIKAAIPGAACLTENSGTANVYEVQDGVATIYGTPDSAGKTVFASGNFEEAVETGALEIISGFVYKNYDASGAPICPLVVSSATSDSQLITIVRWEDKRFYSKDANGSALSFYDGATVYDDYTDRSTAQIKTYIYRESTTEDWTVKMYDITAGADSTKVILTTTLDKNAYPSITSVKSWYWYDNANQKLTITKLSARLVSMDIFKTQATLPASDAIGTISPSFDITFSAAVNPATLSNITFKGSDNVNMIKSITAADDNLSATVALKDLTDGASYTLTVPATVLDSSNNSLAVASKTITASVAKNVLYNLDFRGIGESYVGQTLTLSQVKELTGETKLTENSAIPAWFKIGNGVATIGPNPTTSGTFYLNGNFDKAVETGYLRFDMYIDFDNGVNASSSGKQLFTIYSSNGKSLQLMNMERYAQSYFTATDPSGNALTFYDGATAYDDWNGMGVHTFDLRAYIFRENNTDNWTVRMYDMDGGNRKLILSTTLSSADFPSISGVGAQWWTSTGGDYAQCSYNLRNQTATLVTADEMNYIETAKVKNSADAVITSFAEASDGTVKCAVDLNKLGGKLYAAIYNSTGKLLDVKSVTPTATAANTEITFTGISGASYMKLMYLDSGLKPIITYVDLISAQ